MNARVMISSVTKDQVPLGNMKTLQDCWYQAGALAERLKAAGYSTKSDASIPFEFIRAELNRHLTGKYGFDVYVHEASPGAGRAPETETVLEAQKSNLVIGIFGSKTGFMVKDQDPLTPTLREWRAALATPLKFKVFVLKNSLDDGNLPKELGELMNAVSDYKKGKVYMQFSSAAELFQKVDDTVRDQLNRAMIRYATDTIAREPNTESELWLLSPYRTRVQLMQEALKKVAAVQGIKDGVLAFAKTKQPVALHCVPDSLSIAESKKFVAYIFEDEASGHRPNEAGTLHIVAAFGGVTDLQIRRHLGNFEAAEIYQSSWGYYGSEPGAGIQCVYLPRCSNSLIMESKFSQATSWLMGQEEQIAGLAERRQLILNLAPGSKRAEAGKA